MTYGPSDALHDFILSIGPALVGIAALRSVRQVRKESRVRAGEEGGRRWWQRKKKLTIPLGKALEIVSSDVNDMRIELGENRRAIEEEIWAAKQEVIKDRAATEKLKDALLTHLSIQKDKV